MIISVNYTDQGSQYAMMTYCTFTKDGDQNINGVHVVKQVALVSFIPCHFSHYRLLTLCFLIVCEDQWTSVRAQVNLRYDE